MEPVIICVDDEETVLATLKEQLKYNLEGDFIIEIAESGEEALELLEELMEEDVEIPLIISDQIMPGVKGDELLARAHALLPATLKILLTGQASAEDVGNAINRANLFRYIGKPWEEADLTLTVREAVRSYFRDKDIDKKSAELETLNQELERKVSTFYKFVPVQFLELLDCKNDFDQIKLGLSAECEMSVLFSDIRSFTQYSEKRSPREIFQFINTYLAHMGPIIRDNAGFIDKFIGDAIMGLFETPDDAIRASIHMLRRLVENNKLRKRDGHAPIHIGIGINTGNLMLGTVGEEDRLETTVIGDVVNLASRVAKLTKEYGASLLISEYTFQNLENPDQFLCRFMGKTKVRGKEAPIGVFEIFDADPPGSREKKMDSMKTFKEALGFYNEREFERAQTLFEDCYNKNPDDNIALFYVERCQRILKSIMGRY
ncbi:MAG: response regulator [Desulfobacterales bacterium]|nr:response regulator [Desulfobacterales bacterium]